MAKRAREGKPPPPPPMEGHAHAVYGPWAVRLAMDVLEEDFGQTVRVIAEALVSLGPSSQQELRPYLIAKQKQSTLTGPVWTPHRVRGGRRGGAQALEPGRCQTNVAAAAGA